ncbi:MAG: HAD family hydrolase [Planctomycetota bacterium]
MSRFIATVVAVMTCVPTLVAADELPSWNDAPSKRAIIAFVDRVTIEGSADFVPASERVVVIDNDGTLWCEKPLYVQALFAFDRVRALAVEHPEWKTQEPFASVLRGDMKQALAGGEASLLKLVMATHAGLTTDEFNQTVDDWIRTARHPETDRRYTEMVYQPMLELLDYLRANGFQNFIVSGGGIDFIRVWSERIYGIPPHQVVGSSIKTRYEVRNGKPVIVRLPEIGFIDDKAGKPVGIQSHIGKRPILAIGNSDGDFEMLQWTTSEDGPRLGILIHHTDAEREYAYDRESSVGRLDRGLTEAPSLGWTVVDMKTDWKSVFSESVKE